MKQHRISPPVSPAMKNDTAVSALIGVITMVALVVILTAIISIFLFSFTVPVQKSVYFAADAQYSTQQGYPLVTLFHRGGDPVFLASSGNGSVFGIQISSGSSSGIATPDPAGLVWKPGMALFITRSGTGYNVTNDLTRISGPSQVFPGNEITVSVIDKNNDLLVYSKKLTIAGSYGNVTPTLTQNVTLSPTATANITATATATTNVTANVTATATATVTATATATANVTATATATPTPTATAPVSTRTVTVKWSPSGYGYGSESPPVAMPNGKEILVTRGSSKTIYFVPTASRAVLNIKLDGTTVYTGSSTGSTISYTITNIVEDRTIIATFV
jgi:FlaG/FlaF family flagellin (archaellin)